MMLFVASTLSLNAQMADGSIAPDFTATDINGVEHNLYDLLDQGKSVVLDVSATWCGPCWSYHTAGTLETVWEEYGPEGTDEMYVFMIEGDNSTTMADLQGTGSNTTGDWITGTQYPIIDDGSLADLYEISYYPTLYHICPNRTVTEIGQAQVAAYAAAHSNCPPASGTNNAGVLITDIYDGSFCGELTTTPKITFQNKGEDMITSADFILSVAGEVTETVNWTGNAGTFFTEEITFSPITVMETTELTVEITNVNGGTDSDMSDNIISAQLVGPSSESTTYTVEIVTDNYGGETYWAFLDAAGTVVADGGNTDVGLTNIDVGTGAAPAGGYAANTTETETVTLDADGCYTFVVTDFYGDGMCCAYGDGSFKVTDEMNVVIAQGGEFEGRNDDFFEKASPLNNNEIVGIESLVLFPNPVSDQLTVQFNLLEATEMNVTIYNTLGQAVSHISAANYHAGENQFNVNTSTLENGIYLVSMNSADRTIARKFTVNR